MRRLPVLAIAERPEYYRRLIYAHPSSTAVRWWRAMRAPDYDPRTGTGQSQVTSASPTWVRTEQDVARFRAIVQGAEVMRRYSPEGSYEAGDLTVTSMPDELPFGDHDWIMPVDATGMPGGAAPVARAFRAAETVVRGQTIVPAPGQPAGATVAIDAAGNVTGAGANLPAAFGAGDMLVAAGRGYRVATVAGANAATVVGPVSAPIPQVAFFKAIERVGHPFVAQFLAAETSGTTYMYQRDFTLGGDGQTIRWLTSASPACGALVSLLYDYYPVYVVMPGLGLKRAVIAGTPKPQRVTARLRPTESFVAGVHGAPALLNGEVA